MRRRRNGEKSGVDTDEGKEPVEPLISAKMFSTDDEEREEAEGESRGALART